MPRGKDPSSGLFLCQICALSLQVPGWHTLYGEVMALPSPRYTALSLIISANLLHLGSFNVLHISLDHLRGEKKSMSQL